MTRYPFPDSTDVVPYDIGVFLGVVMCLSVFFVCSEEIIEWVGIQNQPETKALLYDTPMLHRSSATRLVIAVITPFQVAMGMVMVTSLTGLGPIGAYSLWLYILLVCHARYAMYGVPRVSPEYAVFGIGIFLVAFTLWQPGQPVYNLQWAGWYTFLLCVARALVWAVSIVQSNDTWESHPMISPMQHILWDPLQSFRFFEGYIKNVGATIFRQTRKWLNPTHED